MRIDIDRVAAGEMFTMVRTMKADNLSHLQPNTTVSDGKATQTMMVMVDWVEDRGSFLYVGYHPIGKDRFTCTFGATRIFKDGPRRYGVIGFEGRRRIIPEEGKVYATRKGDRYLCISAPGPMSTDESATMQRVSDGWTVNVHNVYQMSDGTVEWGFTNLGHWSI